MGVPSYFKNIIKSYPDILISKENFNYNVNNLFFDLNCLIHPCCRGLTDEQEMYQKIYDGILEIINICKPQDLVYIAIDGVCPRAKIEQQRKRRFKSALEKKIWDTNAITPGTKFMLDLNKFLKTKNYPIRIIFSDSDVRGEGEHKIMHYLKQNNKKSHINIVYGLDADLIHLSLIKQNNIYLLRERTEFNFEDLDTEFVYLDINSLKKYLVHDIKKGYHIDNQTCINDYILLCFFIGNDFIHNPPSINIRYGGLDLLLQTYDKCQKDFSGYFYLIKDNKLNLENFKHFIKLLSGVEKASLEKILFIREKQHKKFINSYNFILEMYKKNDLSMFEEEYILEFKNHLPILDRTDEIKIFKDMNNYKKKYYLFNKYLHHKYDPSFDDILIKEKENVCKNYLESIIWTANYYFNDCLSWKYYYRYHYSPFLTDLNEYLKKVKTLDIIDINDISLTNEEQLLLVLPESSVYLNNNLKKESYYYPKKFFNNTLLKRYDWEGHPVLPN